MSPETALAAASLLGERGQIELLPDAGHFLHLERPDDVEARVLRFLSQQTDESG